jgi:hypothetical protein
MVAHLVVAHLDRVRIPVLPPTSYEHPPKRMQPSGSPGRMLIRLWAGISQDEFVGDCDEMYLRSSFPDQPTQECGCTATALQVAFHTVCEGQASTSAD